MQARGAAPVVAVSALAVDGAGRVLCVRRGREPHRGRWSLPGGRVEVCEDLAAAVVREVAEETGLEVEAGSLLGRVRVPAPDGGAAFDVQVFAVSIRGGRLRPGDDADDVAWLTREQLLGVPVTPGLREVLDSLGAFGLLAPSPERGRRDGGEGPSPGTRSTD